MHWRCSLVAAGLLLGCGRVGFEDLSAGTTGQIGITPAVTISDPATSVGCPAIVWNGSGWGVAWMAGDDVYFARFDAEGIKQGATVTVVRDPYISIIECPALAWSGSEYAVAITLAEEFDTVVLVSTLDASGAPIRSSVPATSYANESVRMSLAWSGSSFHVMWSDRYQAPRLRFRQLDRTGATTGAEVPLSTVESLHSTVVGTPPGSAAIWSERDTSLIRFAALDGAMIAAGMPIATARPVSDQIAAAWTGSKLGLAWLTDPFHLWFSLIDPTTGTATEPHETVETTGQEPPAIASYPGGFGLVLTYPLSIPSLKFGLRDDAGIAVGEAVPLADAGGRPAVAFGDDRFAVVYDDEDRIQLVLVKP